MSRGGSDVAGDAGTVALPLAGACHVESICALIGGYVRTSTEPCGCGTAGEGTGTGVGGATGAGTCAQDPDGQPALGGGGGMIGVNG